MHQDAAIIELQGVDLAFANQAVFCNFSIRLREGDSMVLVGPSGSGKSTLLKLMAGLIEPDRGQVLYRGHALATLSKSQRLGFRSEVGFLFQQNALFDSMTVAENLIFTLKEVKPEFSDRECFERARSGLAAVGLESSLQLMPSQISGGMQKRLGIARALILEPRVVFYDDPTAGLDPITSRKIIQLILDLKEKTKGTIVTVTNDMMRAYQLAGDLFLCLPQEFIRVGGKDQALKHTDARVRQFIRGEIHGPLGGL